MTKARNHSLRWSVKRSLTQKVYILHYMVCSVWADYYGHIWTRRLKSWISIQTLQQYLLWKMNSELIFWASPSKLCKLSMFISPRMVTRLWIYSRVKFLEWRTGLFSYTIFLVWLTKKWHRIESSHRKDLLLHVIPGPVNMSLSIL